MEDSNWLPDRRNRPRPADFAIGSQQWDVLDQGRGCHYTIDGVFWKACWQLERLHGNLPRDWQDNEAPLHLHQKRFEAGRELDSLAMRKLGDLHQSRVRNGHPLSVLSSLVNRIQRFFRESILFEAQPENNVRVEKDQ